MIVTVTCPGCWEPTAFEIAAWEGDVEQVEDCQVCCRSLRVVAHLTPTARDEDDGERDGRDVVFGEPEVEVEVTLNE